MSAKLIRYGLRLNSRGRFNPVIIHFVIGILAGYFLLHPLTMVIYWFEISNTSLTFQNILTVFSERFIHAFHLHMMPMSFVFIVIGGVTGFGSGLYTWKIFVHGQKLQIQQHQLNESIRSIIFNGENEWVEFKKSFRFDYRRGQPDKGLEEIIMRSVAGFMNAKGGILVIGVDYDGQINGLGDDYFSLGKKSREGFEKKFMEVLSVKLGADLCTLVRMAFHKIEHREICSIHIDKASRPVYMRDGDNTLFFLRTGTVIRKLNTQETVEYLKRNIY